jgi:carboxymethylenebutenolidase
MDKRIYTRYNDWPVKIDRREFISKLSVYAGSTAGAIFASPMLDTTYAAAANLVVSGDDQSAHHQHSGAGQHGSQSHGDLIDRIVNYPGATGDVRAYMARPKPEKRYPAVIVIHENRGLQPHIMDVTRRMANEGFLAFAPDALSPYGGTPEDDDITEALRMNRELDYDQAVKNFTAAVKYLETHPLSNGNVGCTGFCWGGAMTNQVAVHAPSLKAAVPYYGSVPPADLVPQIQASVLAHYAGDDPRINQGIPVFREALENSGKDYRIYIYEGTQHAFNNDTNPDRYHPEAARLAWKRTVDFFKEKLGP